MSANTLPERAEPASRPREHGMDETIVDTIYEKLRAILVKVLDYIPLPLHYIFNTIFVCAWLIVLLFSAFAGPLFMVNLVFGVAALYLYNVYLIKRTFGALNPMRILRGDTPAAKRRLGLLPYEQYIRSINKRLKMMRKAAKSSDVPGFNTAKVDQLSKQIKSIEKRLRMLDRLLTKPEFREGHIKTEMAKIEVRQDGATDETMKSEYGRALEHAREHLDNISKLRDERNRLVARMERFGLQLDNTYSRVAALDMRESYDTVESERLFEDLFKAVDRFDETLQELEETPKSGLFQAAVKEVEDTEKKYSTRTREAEGNKTL